MSTDDKVGYGKPPGHSRFKKGQSGNPKGRSSGTRNLKSDLNEELQESVMVREGEHATRISKQRAIVKTLVAKTLRGDSGAARTLTGMMYKVLDPREDTLPADEPLAADDVEILEAFKRRLLASANAAPTGAVAPVEGAESAAAGGDHDDRNDRDEDTVDSEADGAES